jgi:hypothetical protein
MTLPIISNIWNEKIYDAVVINLDQEILEIVALHSFITQVENYF